MLEDNLRKIPPQNLEAESAVLGAVILENDAIVPVSAILKATDFYRESHRKIYQGMIELAERGEPIDVINLSEELKTHGVLEQVGGSAYLASLNDFTPTAANIVSYCRIVKEKAQQRSLIEILREESDRAYEGTEDPETMVRRIMEMAQNLTSAYKGGPSEVKFEREFNMGAIQGAAIEGENPIRYLPIAGYNGFIVKDWTHLLNAYPKSGKTELLARIMPEWPHERILYVTEEPKGVWEARLRDLPQAYNHVVLYLGIMATPAEILERIRSGSETVVIIDTIRNLLQVKDETNNSEIARAIIPYIAAARAGGKTLIAVHHTRKGGGEDGESIAGGHAFLGVVDIAIELKRAGSGQDDDRRRMLRGWGRVIEIPKLVYELLPDNKIKALGSPSEIAIDEVKVRVMHELEPDNESEREQWTKTKDIRLAMEDPRPSEDQILRALEMLARESLVERDPPITEGKRQGARYRWRRNFTSAAPSLRTEVKLNGADGADDGLWENFPR